MFKAIKDMFFQRQPHEDELVKLRQIAERAKQFEQSVVESMNVSFNHTETRHPESHLDSDSMFK
jgi:hypothetical protein